MSHALFRFLRSRAKSFQYAFEGCWFVIRSQPNAWIHALASFLVIGLSIWLRLERRDWAVIVLTIALVWTAEFLNTALEAIATAAADGKQHPLVKVGKDVGAAAVLIAAFASIAIGLLILVPPLLERLGF
ncbi:MAG: diacylglycerol kinase [Anaerolineae bacterium]|jgi:diacylglycerol kinase|nr:MAG: diacylglycerol kinase [Anaerolineae bacterium]